jgi:DNA-binding GntR family transcriptional regulator
MNGSLAPNTRLTQAQVASQLSISTTPVREALRRLAGEGLVRIDAHRGAIVQELNQEELKEIYDLRLLLEPLAAQRAAERISAEQLNAAERLCDLMDRDVDSETWATLNRDFHALIAEAAGSPNLLWILRWLRDRATWYVQWSIATRPSTPRRANDEHRELLAACRDGDGSRAAQIQREHLLATVTAILGSP